MENDEQQFTPFNYTIGKKGVVRYLYIKQHTGTERIKPSARTLYIVNIPPFFTKICIENLFKIFGPIKRIFIQDKPSTGFVAKQSKYFPSPKTPSPSKVGYVVFKDKISMKNALKSGKKQDSVSVMLVEKCGTEQWKKDYNAQFFDTKEVLTEVESFMKEFDRKTEEEKEKEKQVEGVADEDGWITITKQSKKPKILRNEFTSNRLMLKQKRAQAKQTLVNFYKCQLRNAKMDQVLELRKKFENDKKRLALMKASRKFKPV